MKTLTLVCACACNLSCSYCELAKNYNPSSMRLQQNTIQAFKNGTYLNNIKTIYHRLNIDPKTTTNIELWGQEPTLVLDAWYARLEEWCNYFSNLESVFFSTNGVEHTNKIIQLIQLLDKYIIKNNFVFKLQYSYDGEYSTNNLRNISSTTIANNIKYLFNELNKITLKKIKVEIFTHGIISLDLLRQLNTKAKIMQYYTTMDDWHIDLMKYNHNRKVSFNPVMTPAIAMPADATQKDGEALATFTRTSYNLYPINPIIDQLLDRHNLDLPNLKKVHSLDECVERIIKDEKYRNDIFRDINNQGITCGTGVHTLKVMYDGTLLNCQNNMYILNKTYIKNDKTVRAESKISLNEHNTFINLIKDSDEKIINYYRMYLTAFCKNTPFQIAYFTSVLKYLSAIGQVDRRYSKDKKLLLKHILVMLLQETCPYNNQMVTGSIFLKHEGFFKLYFNGMAEWYEFALNQKLQENNNG